MDLAKLQAAVKGRQAELDAKKASGTQVAKIPAGTSRWRILPGWRSDSPELYFHDFGQHWFKDANGKVTAVIVSESETFGRPDPVADLVWGAYRAARDEDTKKRLKELTARRQVLVNAVQTGGAGADPNKVQLLGLPTGLYNKFHELLASRLEDGINILDPNNGRDIVITKSGTGLNTEYSMVDAPKETAVNAGVLEQLHNIDAFIEAERQKGIQKGIGPVNDAIALAIGGVAPSMRSSLSSVLPAAAALPAATLPPPSSPVMTTVVPGAAVAAAAATVAPAVATIVPETVAVAPVAGPAPEAQAPGVQVPGFGGVLDDKDIQDLLSQLGG